MLFGTPRMIALQLSGYEENCRHRSFRIERAPTIGCPLGSPEWIAMLKRRLGRPLAPRKPGPKPASGPGHHAASAATEKHRVSCHLSPAVLPPCAAALRRPPERQPTLLLSPSSTRP